MLCVFFQAIQLLIATLIVLASALSVSSASDQIAGKGEGENAPRFEAYTGADYAGRGIGLNSNAIWSIFGPVAAPGIRLRVGALASVYGGKGANVFSTAFLPSDIKAISDIMLGYQMNYGSLWLKLYAGAAYQNHTMLIWDVGQTPTGESWGAKAAIETWWRVSERTWTSINMSWLQLNNESSLYSRLAYEVLQFDAGAVSLGGEAGATLNDANTFKGGRRLNRYDDNLRGGGLINLRYGTHDLTVSGGLAQDNRDANWRPYATVVYGKKF